MNSIRKIFEDVLLDTVYVAKMTRTLAGNVRDPLREFFSQPMVKLITVWLIVLAFVFYF